MKESAFYSAWRALWVSVCVVVGLALGFFFILFIGGLFFGEVTPVKSDYNQEILPNADEVRHILGEDSPVILQIDIDGVIGLESLTTDSITKQLVESREGNLKHDRVKGILLLIRSPGGTVTDADGIFRALLDYKKRHQVPIYAFVDGLCASGGVYVSLAADKIYATDVSLIGSVGVIAPSFINVTKLMDKVGVEALTIFSGKGKDALNPLRPWKENEGENVKNLISFYYEEFVRLVTTHRPKIDSKQLIDQYGANVFPARLAQEHGFIDFAGSSRSNALRDLADAAKIGDKEYQVIRFETKNWLKNLLSGESSLWKGQVEHSVALPNEYKLRNHYLYYYAP